MSEARPRPRAATPITLDPRRPLPLHGRPGAFLVVEGHVDVFAVGAGGPRRALCRVETGEALLGLPGTAAVEVIAVGAARLQPLAAEALGPAAREAWTSRLAAAIGGAAPTLEAVAAWADLKGRSQVDGVGERMRRDAVGRRAVFSRLVRTIAPTQADALSPPPADADPLFAAMGLVAQSLGLAPLQRPAEAGPSSEFAGVVEIARASGVRVRQTVLRGAWWRQDVGPQVAWRGEARVPVALLPARGGFVVVEPQTARREPVDAAVAAQLSADAAVLYRPPPAAPLSPASLAGWVLAATRADVARAAVAAAAVALASLAAPIFTGVIVGSAILQGDRDALRFSAAALVVAAVGAAGYLAMQSLALLRLASVGDALLQGAAIDKVLRLPARFFEDYSAGDLVDRLFGVAALRRVFGGRAAGGVLAAIGGVFSLALMAVLEARLALAAVVLIALQAGVMILGARRQLRHERRYAAAHGRAHGVVLQMLTGVAKLRVAAATGRALALWTEGFAEQVAGFVGMRRSQGGLTVFMGTYPLVATLVIFALARPGEGGDVGRFLAFFAAFGQTQVALLLLGIALNEVLTAAPVLERVWPVLAAEPEPRPAGGATHRLTGDLEVRDVRFAYAAGQTPVVDRLSFKVSSGEFVALVGPSGGGKSTIMRLLLGFEQPGAGQILFDGKAIEALDMTKLRRQIGVVLQDGRLFSGSLYENICGASILPEAQVWDAVRRAGLEADLANIPMGLHTVIAEGVSSLSGGQRQRLLIARALVHRPSLLLFDEATSALDNTTQAVVTQAIAELAVTRIVIAHRLSTIRDADRILVIDGGRVAQEGDYDTLSRAPGLFADLARRQLA